VAVALARAAPYMPAMPKLTRRFCVFGPLPYDPDVTRTYEMVPGADPLDALLVVHRDGLGSGRVRLVDGVFWFAHPADRELCAGAWRVTPLACNGSADSTIIGIPAVDPADGSRKAA
jgi:hypothetical protein